MNKTSTLTINTKTSVNPHKVLKVLEEKDDKDAKEQNNKALEIYATKYLAPETI